MLDTIFGIAAIALFIVHVVLIVYLLMWVAPRYWLSNVELEIDPELRKPFQ